MITEDEKKVLKGKGFLPTTDGRCSARLITVNGCVTAQQSRMMAEAAEKFGDGRIFYTTRQTVEIPGISYENVEAFTELAEKAGMETGGTGSRVRPIVCCKGSVCVHGLADTLRLAQRIHETYYKGWYNVKLPHKFKIGIGGCPNSCVKPELHEFGIVAKKIPSFDEDMCNRCKKCPPAQICPVKALRHDKDGTELKMDICNGCGKCIDKCAFDCIEEEAYGYQVTVGGKWGKYPRTGTSVPGIFSEEEVMSIIEKTLLVYREQGHTGERLGVTVDRLGADNFIAQILSDSVLERKQEILDAELHLVGGATC